MVIDDDPDVLFATSRVLRKKGYNIIEGVSGQQAIDLAAAHLPDLVLLDAMLPDINGMDVMLALKKKRTTAKIPVIIISSLRIESDDQSHGLETGADAYIARPIENRELLARVEAVLRLKSVEKELEKHRHELEELVDQRTRVLKTEIKKKEAAQALLSRQKRWIAVNNDIAAIFLTQEAEAVYGRITHLLTNTFGCRYGVVGYINSYGDLVCPAVSPNTWPTVVPDSAEKIYLQSDWSGIWAAAMETQTSYLENARVNGFYPEVVLQNAMAAPLVVDGSCIGLIGLAEHPEGFTREDQIHVKMMCEFMAPTLSMFIQREKSKLQLKVHARKLEEKNIALNVLLENRDDEKKKLADQITHNFGQLVFPYFERIKTCQDQKSRDTLLKIMEKNTLESLGPLDRGVNRATLQLTPMEIQVADLIKMGKTSKEISGFLNISPRSVFFHRNNIRKKLGIQGKKTNLRSLLLSVS